MEIRQIARLRDNNNKLLFPGDIYTVQRRLKRLYDTKQVKRTRNEDGSFLYHTKKYEQLEHILGVGWCRIWVMNNFLEHGEKLTEWRHEEEYGTDKIIRPDATFVVWNGFDKVYLRYFLEYETTSKQCTKVADYNIFYEQNAWQGYWWSRLNEGFPSIIIVSDGGIDLNKNTNGLDIIPITEKSIWRDLGL